ncbi:chromate transporter, chromate ion transporter family [Burkholderiales bacterium JOSHI_001]|nr:chromate transporter, chromate ion transporter family [Burkholderiales bacterium JOSHI_001]
MPLPASPTAATPPISFAAALAFWLKLGFVSFGGPAGQIAIMHAELVERRRWISERRFLHALNYCMLLPGPEAQQLATYLGWLMHGTRGGIVAGALFVLPSLLILLALSGIYMAYGHLAVVAGLLYGIKPAVTAIVVQAVHRIGDRALKHRLLWAVAVAAFVAIFVGELPFPAIVAGAAAIGWLGSRHWPQAFKTGGGHGKAGATHAPAWIDDDTPPPPHARFAPGRLAVVVGVGALLWAAPMALAAWVQGVQGPLAQMGWFFTKAALLTFGGAYAVLPYVYQGAVSHFGWLSGAQMIDGLALGETTPGPLIMVVTFVGFVGGWQSSELAGLFGAAHPLGSATVAALLVTWFTFLPSFLFILAGAPLVEATHDDLHFTAPLAAITAAVVGVVLNLALVFGWHVLWPQGWQGPFEWPSALLALGAALALLKFKRGVIEVIAASAVLGLVIHLLRA